MAYSCPKCGGIMTCFSTASIPAIITYKCSSCGYSSEPITVNEIVQVLPKELQKTPLTEWYVKCNNEQACSKWAEKNDISKGEEQK